MRLLLTILISLLCFSQVNAQQADTILYQGGGDVGSVKSGKLGDTYTTDQELTGQNASPSTNGVTIGNTDIPASDLPALIKDKSGDVFSVDADGNTTKVGTYSTEYAGINDKTPDNTTVTVTFSANKDQKYGFDAFRKEYAERPMMEPHYLKKGDQYYSAKAITPGATDVVDFDVQGASKSDITFVNGEGFVFECDGGTVTLAGGPAKDAQEIFAVYNDGTTKTVVGALLLASYPRTEVQVKLILTDANQSVSAGDLADMELELNRAFGQAGLSYRIELDNSLVGKSWCETDNCSFQPSGSQLLSNDYSGDEAKIIKHYTSRTGFTADPNTAYIFAIGAAIDNANGDEGDLQGKMNFDKQFGFLYNVGKSGFSRHGRTMAHELGHGQYKLYHIFETMYLGEPARESDNLMSYSTSVSANKLNKLQWDIVAEPGVTWGVMARDKEQEWTTDGHLYTVQYIAIMLGLEKPDAFDLGVFAEMPDTRYETEYKAHEQDTWIRSGLQQRYHALTGGYHGIELAVTAYALLYTHTHNWDFLLHRFGDSFAHFDISFDSNGLKTNISLKEYIEAFDNFYASEFIKVGQSDPIIKNGKKVTFNEITDYYVISDDENIVDKKIYTTQIESVGKKELVEFLLGYNPTDDDISAKHMVLDVNTIRTKFLIYLPSAKQNTNTMYGDSDRNKVNCFTLGHTSDGSKPDNIAMRQELYLYYVKMLTELLIEKYQVQIHSTEEIVGKIKEIIQYGDEDDKFDAVFGFESAIALSETSFCLPLKYINKDELSWLGIGYYITKGKDDLTNYYAAAQKTLTDYLVKSGNSKQYDVESVTIVKNKEVEYLQYTIKKK